MKDPETGTFESCFSTSVSLWAGPSFTVNCPAAPSTEPARALHVCSAVGAGSALDLWCLVEMWPYLPVNSVVDTSLLLLT